MKRITLDDVIKEQLADNEFVEHYQKELLINAISKMVVKLRNNAHLTQAKLAKKVNTSQSAIARLESGNSSRVPSLSLLIRIASASNTQLNLNFEIIKS